MKGFSLLEILIALAGSLGLLAIIRGPLLDSMSLQALTSNRNVLARLEADLRRSVLEDARFNIAKSKNAELRACMTADGVSCPQGKKTLTLYLQDSKATTGSFSATGETCTSISCAVTITATFIGICAGAANCDTATSLDIDYRILFRDKLYKSGYLQFANRNEELSDDTETCTSDSLGRSMLARGINKGKLNCIPIIAPTRAIAGVTPGDCQSGKEVLVGFDPSGKIICAPILRAP